MNEMMKKPGFQSTQESTLPEIPPATDVDMIAYLRRSHKLAEIAALAERDALVLELCKQFDITVSEAKLQAAGNEFRLTHKLLGATETLDWLSQRITVEDWSQGMRVAQLTKKLKEHLFGEAIDNHYLGNRNDYRCVALSQILVPDITDALKVMAAARDENASFCALALEYSKGQNSKEKGRFAGVHFLARLMSEISQAVSEANAGEVVGPIQTKLGYHVLKVEKWFPAELNESARKDISESLFQNWLQNQGRLSPAGSR